MSARVFRTTGEFMPNSERGPRNPLKAFKAQIQQKEQMHIFKNLVYFFFSA
jgi:hypothetical protein